MAIIHLQTKVFSFILIRIAFQSTLGITLAFVTCKKSQSHHILQFKL